MTTTKKTTKTNEPKNQSRIVEFGKIRDDVLYRIRTERVDHRRDKDYAREVTIVVIVPGFDYYTGRRTYNDYDGPGKVKPIESFLPETLKVGSGVFSSSHWAHADDEREIAGGSNNRVAIFSVTIPFVADKPSEIIDADEALRQIDARLADDTEHANSVLTDGPTTLDSRFPGNRAVHALARAVHLYRKQHEEARAADARRREAAHVAGQIAKEADKKARAVVRFEQRLAGLIAELKAEQDCQVADLIADHESSDDPHVYESTGEEIDPRVIRAALKHVGEFLPGALPGGFPRTTHDDTDKIDIEEVL